MMRLARRARRPRSTRPASRHQLGEGFLGPRARCTVGEGGGEVGVLAPDRRALAASTCLARLGAAASSALALVHQLEMRRDAGLDREAPQQRLAEGVDGLDLEPARRVEHAREKLPRQGEVALVRRALQQLADRLAQRAVLGHGPLGEALAEAVRHLGRGGAGESEAEDFGRRAAAEQQGQDAVGQHLGLAGAGRGADPGRDAAIRGQRLGAIGIGRHSSSSPSPGTDHSLIRARWR